MSHMSPIHRAVERRDCLCCGKSFERTVYINDEAWSRRRYCSRWCNRRTPLNEMQKQESAADQPTAEEIGSKALLIKLVEYGWRNDGLPGLTAAEFYALADKLGVAA